MAATYPTPSASGFEARTRQRLLERRAECKERTGQRKARPDAGPVRDTGSYEWVIGADGKSQAR